MTSISEAASGISKESWPTGANRGQQSLQGQCDALAGSRANEIARYAVATGVRKREDACTTWATPLGFSGRSSRNTQGRSYAPDGRWWDRSPLRLDRLFC